MNGRRFARRIAAATAAGVIVRLAWWSWAEPQPVSDFEYLRRLAEGLIDHQQFGYPRLEGGKAPLWPLVLAGLMLVSRSIAWLSLAASLLSAALTPLVAMMASRLRLPDRVAVAAAWLCALNPTFVWFGPVLATEHLFALLLTASVVVLCGPAGARVSVARAAAAGAVLGLAALARVDALFYLPALVALAWATVPAPRVRALVLLPLCTVLTVTPWYIRNRVVIGPGAGLSTAGGGTFYYGHHDGPYGWHPLIGTPLEGLHQADLNRAGYALGWDYIRRAGAWRLIRDIGTATAAQFSPLSTPATLRWSTRQPGASPDDFTARPLPGIRACEWITAGSYAALLAAALAGLWRVRRWSPRATIWLGGAVLLNWLAHCWVYLGDPRYRYAAEVSFCVLAAVAISVRNSTDDV